MVICIIKGKFVLFFLVFGVFFWELVIYGMLFYLGVELIEVYYLLER